MKLNELASEIKYKDILKRYNYNWLMISCHKYLSEEFIEYYKNKLDWNSISICQKLSEEFKIKFKTYLK